MLLGIEVASVVPPAGLSPAVEQAVALAVEHFEAVRNILLDPAASAWQSPQRFPPDDAFLPAGLSQRAGVPGRLKPNK
jgi:hypothetical protein